jgi:hypothetical protein
MCRSTILVQASVTKVVKQKKNTTGTSELKFQMEIDPVLRKFLTTDGCLWKVVDEHYDNPPHEGMYISIHIFRYWS